MLTKRSDGFQQCQSERQGNFDDIATLKNQIMEDLQYADSYYECLIHIFNQLTCKSTSCKTQRGQNQQINYREEYLHSVYNQFMMKKTSKLMSSELVRFVRITEKGLIQVMNGLTERLLEYVELDPKIQVSNQIQQPNYKLVFVNKKNKKKWVFTQHREDAIKIRDFCVILGAQNNIKYNISGFLQMLSKMHRQKTITNFNEKIHKQCQVIDILRKSKQLMKQSSQERKFQFQQSLTRTESSMSEQFENVPQISQALVQDYLNQYLDKLVNQLTYEDDKTQTQDSSYSQEIGEMTEKEIKVNTQVMWIDYKQYI